MILSNSGYLTRGKKQSEFVVFETRKGHGNISIGNLYLPKDMIGKRVSIKCIVEIIGE